MNGYQYLPHNIDNGCNSIPIMIRVLQILCPYIYCMCTFMVQCNVVDLYKLRLYYTTQAFIHETFLFVHQGTEHANTMT